MRWLIVFIGLLLSGVGQGATVHYMTMVGQGRPFQIEEHGTRHSGIITDIVYEIFSEGPHTLETHTFPYARMKKMMASGKYPNWLRYGSPVWGQLNENLSEEPVLEAENVLLLRKGTDLELHQLEDLFGRQLILLHGFSYNEIQPFIDLRKIGATYVKGYEQAYAALNEERGIALLDIKVRMRYNAYWLGLNWSDYKALDFSSVIPNYSIHLNMDPAMDSQVQAFINSRLAQLKRSGFVDEVINRYAPQASESSVIAPFYVEPVIKPLLNEDSLE